MSGQGVSQPFKVRVHLLNNSDLEEMSNYSIFREAPDACLGSMQGLQSSSLEPLIWFTLFSSIFRAVARQDDTRCETQNWHPPHSKKIILVFCFLLMGKSERIPFSSVTFCHIDKQIQINLIKMTPLLKMMPCAAAHPAHTQLRPCLESKLLQII